MANQEKNKRQRADELSGDSSASGTLPEDCKISAEESSRQMANPRASLQTITNTVNGDRNTRNRRAVESADDPPQTSAVMKQHANNQNTQATDNRTSGQRGEERGFTSETSRSNPGPRSPMDEATASEMDGIDSPPSAPLAAITGAGDTRHGTNDKDADKNKGKKIKRQRADESSGDLLVPGTEPEDSEISAEESSRQTSAVMNQHANVQNIQAAAITTSRRQGEKRGVTSETTEISRSNPGPGSPNDETTVSEMACTDSPPSAPLAATPGVGDSADDEAVTEHTARGVTDNGNLIVSVPHSRSALVRQRSRGPVCPFCWTVQSRTGIHLDCPHENNAIVCREEDPYHSIHGVVLNPHLQMPALLQPVQTLRHRRLQCLGCFQAFVDTVLRPCMHVVSCHICARTLTACPRCGQLVLSFRNIIIETEQRR